MKRFLVPLILVLTACDAPIDSAPTGGASRATPPSDEAPLPVSLPPADRLPPEEAFRLEGELTPTGIAGFRPFPSPNMFLDVRIGPELSPGIRQIWVRVNDQGYWELYYTRYVFDVTERFPARRSIDDATAWFAIEGLRWNSPDTAELKICILPSNTCQRLERRYQ